MTHHTVEHCQMECVLVSSSAVSSESNHCTPSSADA